MSSTAVTSAAVRNTAAASASDSAPETDSEDAPAFKAGFGWKDMLGVVGSICIHLLILLPLAAFHFATQSDDAASFLSSLEDLRSDEEFDASATDVVGTTGPINMMTPSGLSSAAEPDAIAERVELPEGDAPSPELASADEAAMPVMEELTQVVDSPNTFSDTPAGGTGGAIDRLVFEIRESLRTKKTTVVWMLDASQSLKDRHALIADRFENVYSQLKSLDPKAVASLQSAIWTFGEKLNPIAADPVVDISPFVEKVRNITYDESGIENVFSALNVVTKKMVKHSREQRRRVLIIIVTDERGDDPQHLDEVINTCRRAGMKVYVVGNAALFGREKGFVNWKLKSGRMVELPVDQGPETVEPEGLQLAFWGNRGPNLERMSAGFGPYALTRLCKETNGMYFVAEESRDKFDPAIMRLYAPDYRPIREYMKGLERNKAKAAVVMAAKASKLEEIPLPQLEFRADNDNILREQISEAQKPAAVMGDKLMRLELILRQGEKDREKVSEPRWRAAYDLALGRVLAMRARFDGYNQMLAEMRSQVKAFKNADSNQWRLVPSRSNQAAASIRKVEKQALSLLKRVIDEHPGTPWARIAEAELAQDTGWEWQEAVGNYQPLNMNMGDGNRPLDLADDEEKKKEEKKKMKREPEEPLPRL